ncbi:MAG TPA: hypothetical protein VFL30_10450, partial [Rhodanobacteraceae bacterium]|nr:hypothetical protein [Rhodanobacteraceae bacterium]
MAQRAELYERIAGIESTAELERLARGSVAAQDVAAPPLELVFERYFELDPAGAVTLAGELLRSRSPSLLVSLYARLAQADVNAALAALSQLDDPTDARPAAMAVLRALGADERAYELVLASLHGEAREQFTVDALPQLATTAPQKALDAALALTDPEKRSRLALVIVSTWVGNAPSEALAAVDAVADPALQVQLHAAALRSWRDTDSLFAYVATLGPEHISEALAGGVIERLARADPQRTAAIVAALPAGEERPRLLSLFGYLYAQRDPEGAFAWARSLDPPAPEAVANAIQFVASREPLRAFDLAGSLDEPQRTQTYFSVVNARIDAAQLPALASRVARIDDGPMKAQLMMTLVQQWAERNRDPEGAVAWMSANEAAVPAEAFERVAYIFARSSPNGAAAYVDRVPSGARAGWIAAVTLGYATTDLQAATQFLERFRGEPGFDRGAPQLAMQMAESDPAAAARLLASVGTRSADGAAPEFTIARNWAQRDPAAAAAWAIDLPPLQRTMALVMVTRFWGSQDPDVVRQWALGMPLGDRRDLALAAAMQARGAAPPDPALLAAFSQDRARQAALMSTILVTAQTDAAAARRLIGEHITDPRMRAQAEEVVESFARGTAPLTPAGAFGGVPGFAPGGSAMSPGSGRMTGLRTVIGWPFGPMIVIGWPPTTPG